MNEQDLILRQKIEKREKIDTILAYILIVVLLGAIILILYLKFLRKAEMIKPEEYVPNYISLTEISNSLNNSALANLYLNDNANFSSSVSSNVLMVTYSKEDNNISLNIPQIGHELEFILTEENNVVSKDIYIEIASIICMHYGNSETTCRSIINNASESNQVKGMRFVKNMNNNYVYISINESVDINHKNIYNTVTKVNIDEYNYKLNLEGYEIFDVRVVKEKEILTFNGNVKSNSNDNSNFAVNIKLYDDKGDLKGENTYSYNADNLVQNENTFSITFSHNEEDINNIKQYSIEITK